jgi:sugar-specific transcriptional regulator TrmB
MNTQLLNWLLSTGLDEQRAKVYLSALAQGEAQAKDIAEEVGMNRTAVYDNLRFLEERGYVTTVHQGKRKVFVPLHPKELYKKFGQQVDQLKDLLPDFLALYAEKGQKPFVQLFTGPYAAREVYEDILAVTKKEYHYFSAQQLTYQTVDTAYMKKWVQRRVKKRIESYSLRVQGKDVKGEKMFNEEAAYLRHIRYLPAYVDLRSTVYIYENNIGVISSQREGTASITHSPDMAYTFRQVFQFLWSVSTKS